MASLLALDSNDPMLPKSIHDALRSREALSPQFRGASPFLARRYLLVDWIHDLGAAFKLHPATVHSAIYLIDTLMDQLSMDQGSVHISAIACLLISAKCEEAELDVPRVEEVISRTGNTFRKRDIIETEISILDYYAWHVNIVVPVMYLDYYLEQSEHHPKNASHQQQIEELRPRIREHAEFFIESALQDYHFSICYRPSIIAAAAVTAARHCVGVTPHWTAGLQVASNLAYPNILACMQDMIKVFQEAKAQMPSPATIQTATRQLEGPVPMSTLSPTLKKQSTL